MASQPPKFQYNPNIQDIVRAMPSFQRDLAQEADGTISQEVAVAVNMLAQHDRQLEDYLTNLSPGGGLKFIEYFSFTTGAPVYTANSDPTFPGVVDQYSLTTTAFINAGSTPVPPSGFGLTQVQTSYDITYPGSITTPVQAFLSVSFPAPQTGYSLIPWASGGSISNRQFQAVVAAFTATPVSVNTILTIVQPVGSANLGSGAVTFDLTDMTVIEFS